MTVGCTTVRYAFSIAYFFNKWKDSFANSPSTSHLPRSPSHTLPFSLNGEIQTEQLEDTRLQPYIVHEIVTATTWTEHWTWKRLICWMCDTILFGYRLRSCQTAYRVIQHCWNWQSIHNFRRKHFYSSPFKCPTTSYHVVPTAINECLTKYPKWKNAMAKTHLPRRRKWYNARWNLKKKSGERVLLAYWIGAWAHNDDVHSTKNME